MTKPKRPAKRPTPLPLGRPIDRLQPLDRERIQADVAAFLAYVRRRKNERSMASESLNDA